ncbi:hypothetical protein [Dyadobacter bucti]|uniref:hypothetical protein n=1 Tax=Dyadobacter bucti TaxID=2572203 RepID=UPI001109644E|nr:hypothetical protein [Dyadobacter bucti]
MRELKKLIGSVTRQLYANALLRCILLAGSGYLLVAGFSDVLSVPCFAGIIAFMLGVILTRIYQNKKTQAITLIHSFVNETEYSLHLLEKDELNPAEQLQLERIDVGAAEIRFPFSRLYAGAGLYFGLLLFSGAVFAFSPYLKFSSKKKTGEPKPTDIVGKITSANPPKFESAKVLIQFPDYTRLPKKEINDLNISAIVGSMINWEIVFSGDQDISVKLVNSRAEEVAFAKSDDLFRYSDRLHGSGLYAIKAYRKDSLIYQSDFYRLEALPDLAPVIKPASKELYRYHFINDKKQLAVSAGISDDFLVRQAFIVATVARGSGENVKFRELKFPLQPSDFKEANLQKVIDLNALNFAPGDELYYYWAAADNKEPDANFSKSDTYFIVYNDTAQVEEAELAAMAVNIMPEYFRSQRQIIIDTEKLIAKRKKLGRKEFASQSNEIGFDQKVLRLRYGQYLGEEFETNIGGGETDQADEGNILDSFTHKSDGTGEGAANNNTEPIRANTHDDHDHAHKNEASKDPLAALMEQYTHAHDDAETNTFYEESTRSLLKMALEQMWQSELHLRTYEPEKALPFETKALEFLKSAQQKARTFAKKSGYDPPPIREKEKRLTGELKDINSALNSEKVFDRETTDKLAAEVLGYLEYAKLSEKQKFALRRSGSELSQRLINSGPFNGGFQNWQVIGLLQKMIGGKTLSALEKEQLKTAVFKLTNATMQSRQHYLGDQKLEEAFWKKMKRGI